MVWFGWVWLIVLVGWLVGLVWYGECGILGMVWYGFVWYDMVGVVY